MASDYRLFKEMLDRQIARQARIIKSVKGAWSPMEYEADVGFAAKTITIEKTCWVFDKRSGKLVGMSNWKD